MNIGFVSTWFERGAAYVTKSYLNLLKEDNKVFVYARGGEKYGKGDPNWDLPYVTWSPKLLGTNINYNHFKKWIKKNNINIIFFNEQNSMDIVYKIKQKFPSIKLCAYIDYYKENTVKEFWLYDFLICNTKRHYSIFKEHPQSFYIPWGTDTNLFKPKVKNNKELTFFHSAGMSDRKGTSFVVDAFIKGGIYDKAKLIIHTQTNIEKLLVYDKEVLRRYNIKVIEETVTAPGLYYLGDVFVYPTMLDGLGLTMYEALSSGMPVITTNHPPMNEVVNNKVGYLVDVDYLRSRADGYYWPLSIIKISSLIKGMTFFIENPAILVSMKENARKEALKYWQWENRKKEINNVFINTKVVMQQPSKTLLRRKSVLEKMTDKLGSSYFYSILKSLKIL